MLCLFEIKNLKEKEPIFCALNLKNYMENKIFPEYMNHLKF